MFTEPETWSGGSIELLVALGDTTADRQLQALQCLWQWSALSGPYAQSKIEPAFQAPIQPTLGKSLYGVATLPGCAGQVAFATSFVEDEDGSWLYAGIPLGSLGTVYEVGAFPFDEGFAAWQREVFAWLYSLAQHLFQQVPFERGVIGWLTIVEVDELARRQLPEKRYQGYVVAENGILKYYAPNQDGALVQ